MNLATEIAAAYDAAHDACTAAMDRGVLPRDIADTWPNVRGFLERIPGQRYHRPGPNGREDPPSDREIKAAIAALKIHARRADDAIALADAGIREGTAQAMAFIAARRGATSLNIQTTRPQAGPLPAWAMAEGKKQGEPLNPFGKADAP